MPTYFFIAIASDFVFPGSGQEVNTSMIVMATNMIIYLGIPFFGGIPTRYTLLPRKGADWNDNKFVPKIDKISLLALLFSIVVMFSLRAESIVNLPLDVIRIAIPLLVYFIIMFLLSFYSSIRLRFDYPHAVAQTYTASSNKFELAIAVAVGVFGMSTGVAFAAVIGPLVKVPVLISLVNLAFWFRKRYYGPEDKTIAPETKKLSA